MALESLVVGLLIQLMHVVSSFKTALVLISYFDLLKYLLAQAEALLSLEY